MSERNATGQSGKTGPAQRDISTSLVTLRHPSLDEAGGLENTEVMRQQVASHLRRLGELGNGAVPENELIDDEETTPISERCMSIGSVTNLHAQTILSQFILSKL